MASDPAQNSESARLAENDQREQNWQRWGPYLAERQWATVREDDATADTFWESFPYEQLRRENGRIGRDVAEYELIDTGVFDESRYRDITVEYAKAAPDDILIRLTVANRSPGAAQIHVLFTLWFRNTWGWQAGYDEGQWAKPTLTMHLSLAGRSRLERSLRDLLDEAEFLSPFGVRSLSMVSKDNPYHLKVDGKSFTVGYVPGDMDSVDFGGNSNWRGPIWMPLNFVLCEALREYHRSYGDGFQIKCPTGSGNRVNLDGAADELSRRLSRLSVLTDDGARPCQGAFERFATDPHWQDHELFEYFHGDTGRGLGASHR